MKKSLDIEKNSDKKIEYVEPIVEKFIKNSLSFVDDCEDFKKYRYQDNENFDTYFAEMFKGVYVELADYKDVTYFYEANYHDEENINITYCFDGRVEWTVKNQKAYFSKNGMMVSRIIGGSSEWSFPEGRLKCITFIIFMNYIDDEFKNFLDMFDLHIEDILSRFSTVPKTIKNNEIINRVFSPFSENFFMDIQIYKIKLAEILFVISNMQKTEFSGMVYYSKSQIDKIIKIKEYLLLDLSQNHTLQEICGKFNISSTQLKETFKSYFGLSVKQFVISERLKYAQKLLLESDMSITDIANTLGYSNTSKFSKIFKDKYAITPLKFKNNRR